MAWRCGANRRCERSRIKQILNVLPVSVVLGLFHQFFDLFLCQPLEFLDVALFQFRVACKNVCSKEVGLFRFRSFVESNGEVGDEPDIQLVSQCFGD